MSEVTDPKELPEYLLILLLLDALDDSDALDVFLHTLLGGAKLADAELPTDMLDAIDVLDALFWPVSELLVCAVRRIGVEKGVPIELPDVLTGVRRGGGGGGLDLTGLPIELPDVLTGVWRGSSVVTGLPIELPDVLTGVRRGGGGGGHFLMPGVDAECWLKTLEASDLDDPEDTDEVRELPDPLRVLSVYGILRYCKELEGVDSRDVAEVWLAKAGGGGIS